MTPRQAAVLSVNSAFKNGRFLNIELDSSIKKYGFEEKDKAFYTRLVYGTVEKKLTLDFFIEKLSNVKLDKIEPMVLAILETALYQIFYMDRVPDFSACNEATETVKILCPKSYAGYVNAVLRNAIRQKTALQKDLASLRGSYGVSIRCNIPLWICKKWEKDYGMSAEIAKGFENIAPHLTLRVNTLKTTADKLYDMFLQTGEDLGARKIGDILITLKKSVPVETLPGFEEGFFFVQDESSALCAALIGKNFVKSDEPLVIDTCACPGGKTFAMAIQLENKGKVLSCDLHENRLSLIENGTKRLGITSVTTEARDARKPNEALFGKADAVLCDVPCSGLGILAKKPDIRFKTEEDIERLPSVQREILFKSAAYVKPGGLLVYSTCTLRKAENEDNVLAFFAEHPDFVPVRDVYGSACGYKTFFPHKDGTDGFFIAAMRRKTES